MKVRHNNDYSTLKVLAKRYKFYACHPLRRDDTARQQERKIEKIKVLRVKKLGGLVLIQ